MDVVLMLMLLTVVTCLAHHELRAEVRGLRRDMVSYAGRPDPVVVPPPKKKPEPEPDPIEHHSVYETPTFPSTD